MMMPSGSLSIRAAGWYNGPAVSWIRIPDRVLPRPPVGELPDPVPLRRMLGPSVILVGLSIGSGEFILWPRLTAEWGFVLFWACWVGLTLQFFLNMEIERFTLATGESAVLGFVRLSRFWAPVFFQGRSAGSRSEKTGTFFPSTTRPSSAASTSPGKRP